MKRLRSYLVSIFVIVLLLTGLFQCTPQASAEENAAASKSKATVAVKSVKLSKTSITIEKVSTVQLKVIIEPKNATNKEVTWKSSDPKIIKVDKLGKVTAMKEGEAMITVTSIDGKKTAECFVTVSKKDDSDTVYMTDDSFEFAQAVSELTSGDDITTGIASGDDFYSKRLIVKAKTNTIDMTIYKPIKIIIGPDNIYILQFDTTSATKAAFNELVQRSDIIYVEPDQYVGINVIP